MRVSRKKQVVDDEPQLYKRPKIKARTENQQYYIDTINEKKVVIVRGCAGTGKTAIAIGVGIDLVLRKEFNRLLLVKAIQESGEKLGFLPGSVAEKTEPFMIPFIDELLKFINVNELKQYIANGAGRKWPGIEMCPMAYMRGRTIEDCFIVVDECFTGDTIISYSNDHRKDRTSIKTIIDKFSNNDKIILNTYNKNSNCIEQKSLLNIFDAGIKQVMYIYLENKKIPIKVTPNHPFGIMENHKIKWKLAQDLQVNDHLLRQINKNSNNALIFPMEANDILLGFILGDGWIGKNIQKYNRFRLGKNHGLNQIEYCKFCQEILLGSKNKSIKSGYTGKPLYGFQSKSFFIDGKFISSCYLNNKKRITDKISEYMSVRTLALWLMDDGSMYRNTTQFHTNGFSLNENEILSDILKNKFGLNNKILISAKKDKKYYYLSLGVKESKSLSDMVAGYIHPTLKYKVVNYSEFRPELYKINYNDQLTFSRIVNIIYGGYEKVYNLETEDNHNYFADKILVHNCQNFSKEQLKLILTRLGKGSKIVLAGDVKQSDIPNGGFDHIIKSLHGLNSVGMVALETLDIQRDPIIGEILDRI